MQEDFYSGKKLVTGSTTLAEIQESDAILSKAFDKVVNLMDEYGKHLDKILEKEMIISKLHHVIKDKRRIVERAQYSILTQQIRKLEIEGEKLLLKIREAEKELLSTPNLDEHIERIGECDRETVNILIRTISLIRFEHMKRRS